MKSKENKNPINQQFLQVIPDSQFFTNLDQIESYLKCVEVIDREYLLIAIKNTIKNGFELIKNKEKCSCEYRIHKRIEHPLINTKEHHEWDVQKWDECIDCGATFNHEVDPD